MELETAHLEFEDGKTDLNLLDDADVRVLAGDISEDLTDLNWVLGQGNIPMVYVAGNHEFFDTKHQEKLTSLRDFFKDTNVHFLENSVVDIGGFRFIGATLWTDLELNDTWGDTVNFALDLAEDFRLIKYISSRLLTPEIWCGLHRKSVDFIRRQLTRCNPGKTIVVTHYAPSEWSIPERFKSRKTAPFFASSLEPLIEEFQPAAWIHGHIHDSCDYRIGRTRVVCNPRGYPPRELNHDFQNPFSIDL